MTYGERSAAAWENNNMSAPVSHPFTWMADIGAPLASDREKNSQLHSLVPPWHTYTHERCHKVTKGPFAICCHQILPLHSVFCPFPCSTNNFFTVKIRPITNPFVFKVNPTLWPINSAEDPLSLTTLLCWRGRKLASQQNVLQRRAKGWRPSTEGCRSCRPMTMSFTYQSKSICDDFDTSCKISFINSWV